MTEKTQMANPRDWPEDFAHENGNYFCTCGICGGKFTGHKRRVVCRKCKTAKWLRTSRQRSRFVFAIAFLIIQTIFCLAGNFRGVIGFDAGLLAMIALVWAVFRIGLWIEHGDDE